MSSPCGTCNQAVLIQFPKTIILPNFEKHNQLIAKNHEAEKGKGDEEGEEGGEVGIHNDLVGRNVYLEPSD